MEYVPLLQAAFPQSFRSFSYMDGGFVSTLSTLRFSVILLLEYLVLKLSIELGA